MENAERVNSEILEYIKEIASKMKNNRAAVMVGAGFSKNAEAITQTDKEFLDWNALGDEFFKKVNGRSPDKEKYLNVLKLAEEVEAAYGRTVLNEIIRDSLPDADYAPSKLHEKLLSLNWKDVFTTNYDTLLERTQERITDRHYSIIVNKEDLIYSAEPRIIKLHGSFPSTLPFIITEEDYRQYPKKSAVFVNTVQQTLIENVLCLIGFSGDDPNFLQWIGWIRDNLGKDMASKIYLIGVFNFSTAQLNLLNSRNIVVLNMKKCEGIVGHKDGLELFLNTLSDLTKEKDENKWPKGEHCSVHYQENNVVETLNSVIAEWENTRKDYPGWFVIPYDRRTVLLRNTQSCDMALIHIAKGIIQPENAIRFLYEYSWRLNKCLCPISKQDIKAYEKTVFSFNPFPEKLSLGDNEHKYYKNAQDWDMLSYMWIELLLDMFRTYRENGQFGNLNRIANILGEIQDNLTKEQQSKLQCETVRKYMFQLNIKGAKEALEKWSRNISLPEWEIKRAGILMELGDASQAFKVISDELNYIRKGHTKEINYYKISIEAYLKILASYCKQALGIYNEEFEIKTKDIFNPHIETKLFETALRERPKPEYEKETFDLGRITRTIISSEDKSYVEAFQFVRYFEEIGMPFNCNHIVSSKNAGIEAISRITPYSTLWSLILQVKIADTKIIENIWSREVIAHMTNDEIENMGQFCISALQNNLEIIEKGDRWRESNFQLGIAEIMPEILSRLCTRMPDKMKLQTLEILDTIYQTNNIGNFKNLKNLAHRLIKSLSENMKIKHFDVLTKVFLRIPKNEIEKRELGDIFDEFSYQESNKDKFSSIEIDANTTDVLMQLINKDEGRELALQRLAYFYKFGLLTSDEAELFKNILWSKTDKYGLPEIPDFYSKSYLFDLPVPKGKDIKKLIKEYILSLEIPKQTKGITLRPNGNKSLLLLELALCTNTFENKNALKWTSDEIKILLDKIIDAWDNDKQYLMNEDEHGLDLEIADIVYDKYNSLDNVISQVLISNEFNFEDRDTILKFAKDLQTFGLPYIQLKILIEKDIRDFNEIYNIICGNDERKFVSTCDTVYTLTSMNDKNYEPEIIKLLEKLSFMIRTRRAPGLTSIIYLMHNLIYSDLLPENSVILDNILFGLDCLLEETKLDNNALNLTVNQCISLRVAANSLAYIIFKKHTDNNDICEHLLPWKELSNDLSEFSEVRNKWLDI